MSRVVNTNGVGRKREQLCRAIVLAMREMAARRGVDEEARDTAAFIALALEEIQETVEATVSAWEKRDYWLKADQFHLQWDWANTAAQKMKSAVEHDDWAAIAALLPVLAKNLASVKLPKRKATGKPWEGAYARLMDGRRG